jgi:erythromycin esterase
MIFFSFAFLADKNYRSISISDKNTNDLLFLDTLLKDKTIVMLGESAHGIEEYSLLKFRIIKHLHEKLGFNVLAFESGISECAFLNEMKDKLSSKELLEKGIVQVWQTQSNLKLLEYIRDNGITVVGFDHQISTPSNSEFLKIAIEKFDKNLADKVYQLDTTFYSLYFNNSKLSSKESSSKYEKLKLEIFKTYEDLISKVDSLLIQTSNNTSRSSLLTLKKVIQNKLYLTETYSNSKRYSGQRDSIMSFNLQWAIDSMKPNEKVIIWAHNSHISKTGLQTDKSYMGKLLNDFYGNRIYNIGLYAYKGEIMDVWRRSKITIATPSSNSLENYLHINGLNNKATFLNFSNGPPDKNNLWTTQQVKAFSWGMRETYIVPRDEFDAVILINLATTPKYIN